jgi:hypothetical protein
VKTAKELREEAERLRRVAKRTAGSRVWFNPHLEGLASKYDEQADAAEALELAEGALKKR